MSLDDTGESEEDNILEAVGESWDERSLGRRLNTYLDGPPIDLQAAPREPQPASWNEFCAQAREDERQPWLLPPFLPPRGIVLLSGEAKSGKTILAAHWVNEVLRRGRRVLLVEKEGSRGTLRARVELGGQLDRSGLAIAFRSTHDIETEEGVERLSQYAKAFGASLVVLDPLVRFMSGEENESSVMRRVCAGLDALAEAIDGCVLPVHHVRKAGKDGRRSRLTSADVRGSSVLVSAAAVIAVVTKLPPQQNSEVGFELVCADSWYEPFPSKLCVASFASNTFTMRDLGESKTNDMQARILRLVRAEIGAHPAGISQNAIEQAVKGKGLGGKGIRLLLDEMVATGEVTRETGARNAWIYRSVDLDGRGRSNSVEFDAEAGRGDHPGASSTFDPALRAGRSRVAEVPCLRLAYPSSSTQAPNRAQRPDGATGVEERTAGANATNGEDESFTDDGVSE
jgi:hypothetical protein